jgi:hypothetical protein
MRYQLGEPYGMRLWGAFPCGNRVGALWKCKWNTRGFGPWARMLTSINVYLKSRILLQNVFGNSATKTALRSGFSHPRRALMQA